MEICIIGTGYVGLVTGSIFADLGNDVICIDKDGEKIKKLSEGFMPIYEPGLREMVIRNLSDKRLSFSTDLDEGVRRCDIVFICVDTPAKGDGETDLSNIEEVAKRIARSINKYKVIVNKSTVPVGTGDLVKEIIELNKRRDIDFDVVSNPEFLREGSAIQDALNPDRIVIGASNREAALKLLELYAPLQRPMIVTDVYSAEMIKYASNAFLAAKISFINSIADICEVVGADVEEVAKGIGYDRRIGHDFLQAGIGFGGSCFPKDSESLVHTASKLGYDFKILKEVIEVNKNRCSRFLRLINDKLNGAKGKTIAVLGLSFKPDTDDMREAKSIPLMEGLIALGANIKAYDPAAIDNSKKIFRQIEYCKSSYEASEAADAIVIATEWREFKQLDLEKIKKGMRTPVIFDGRNIYNPERVRRFGFKYYSVGRKQ